MVMFSVLVLSIVSSNYPQNLGQFTYVPSNLAMTNFGSLAWIPMAHSVTEITGFPALAA